MDRGVHLAQKKLLSREMAKQVSGCVGKMPLIQLNKTVKLCIGSKS